MSAATAITRSHRTTAASDTSLETFWITNDDAPEPRWEVEFPRLEPVEGVDIFWVDQFNRLGVDFQEVTPVHGDLLDAGLFGQTGREQGLRQHR